MSDTSPVLAAHNPDLEHHFVIMEQQKDELDQELSQTPVHDASSSRRAEDDKQMRNAMLCLSLMLLLGQEPPKESWSYRSFTSDFEQVADSTIGLPIAERVKVFHSTFDKLYPGLYPDVDQSRLDGRIEKALTGFPSIRSKYDEVERKFPEALASSIKEFRGAFPDFTPPIPIYLIHSLGTRDGGTDLVAGWSCCSERTKSPSFIGTSRLNRS